MWLKTCERSEVDEYLQHRCSHLTGICIKNDFNWTLLILLVCRISPSPQHESSKSHHVVVIRNFNCLQMDVTICYGKRKDCKELKFFTCFIRLNATLCALTARHPCAYQFFKKSYSRRALLEKRVKFRQHFSISEWWKVSLAFVRFSSV